MGWDFGSYESKQEFVDSLTQSYEDEGAFYTCMEHKSYSGVMWSVWQRLDKKSGKASREIWCDLIKGSAPHFGHKAMSESMGPFYYSCPLEYLDLVPDPESKYSKGWRDEVRKFHAQRSEK